MKLIQKTLFSGNYAFEVKDDHIDVIFTRRFKSVKTSIPLIDINPTPQAITPGSAISFTRQQDNFHLFSIISNKPDSDSVQHFIDHLQQAIAKHCKFLEEKKSNIKAYSQRLTPPFSGLVQIAESEFARALTMDGKTWEFQHLLHILDHENKSGKKYQRRHSHALTVDQNGLRNLVNNAAHSKVDDSLLKIAEFINDADFPFAPTDRYEYWLLDAEDNAPLALMFSCSSEEEISSFPDKTEWTALPAAAMPIDKTEEEKEQNLPPVNYRVEQMVRARAGYKPMAQWFKRQQGDNAMFPPLLLREEWPNETQADLCRRYLDRQASRLLMLQNLIKEDRQRLERAAKANVFEVERFYPFYPEVIDQKLMNSILVEARLRNNAEANDPRAVQNRRDGVLYQ